MHNYCRHEAYVCRRTNRPGAVVKPASVSSAFAALDAPSQPLPRTPRSSRIKGALNSFSSDGLSAAPLPAGQRPAPGRCGSFDFPCCPAPRQDDLLDGRVIQMTPAMWDRCPRQWTSASVRRSTEGRRSRLPGAAAGVEDCAAITFHQSGTNHKTTGGTHHIMLTLYPTTNAAPRPARPLSHRRLPSSITVNTSPSWSSAKSMSPRGEGMEYILIDAAGRVLSSGASFTTTPYPAWTFHARSFRATAAFVHRISLATAHPLAGHLRG